MQKLLMVVLVGLMFTLIGCNGVIYAPYPAANVVVVDDGPVYETRYYNPTTHFYYDAPCPGTVVVYGYYHHVHGERVWYHDHGYTHGHRSRVVHSDGHPRGNVINHGERSRAVRSSTVEGRRGHNQARSSRSQSGRQVTSNNNRGRSRSTNNADRGRSTRAPNRKRT